MVGVQGQVFGHLVRRGIDAVRENEQANIIMAKLRHDAELYENSGSDKEISPLRLLPVFVTVFLLMVLIASIRYTIGEVVAALTMIEAPTTTAIIEDKPPAYTDEPDAPLEKETALPVETESGVAVTLIKNKPVTSKITTSIGHLNRVGGFRARWRGLGWSIAYHMAHGLASNAMSSVFDLGFFGHTLAYIASSLAFARLHMAWTHSMIAHASKKSIRARIVPRKQCKVLILPAFVFALAQQATIILPVGIAFAVGLTPDSIMEIGEHAGQGNCRELMTVGLLILAPIATAAFVALAVLLPASVTLTRIEAALLPEGEETIVPFDRQAIIGNVDIAARGSSKLVFLQAWRSFDCAARWRLIKLYTKMVLIQFTTFVIGLHFIVAELYIFGGEKLALLIKSGAAQMQLAAIEASENASQN